MQIKAAWPHLTLAASAILILSGLFWWKTDDGSQTDDKEFVTVQAASPPATGPRIDALALMEPRILEAIGEPGTRLRDLRIVDQERLIVCGERLGRGFATSRRFVWLNQLRQVVIDDGGPDFAILVHVCNPPAPSRIQSLSPSGTGEARSRRLD